MPAPPRHLANGFLACVLLLWQTAFAIESDPYENLKELKQTLAVPAEFSQIYSFHPSTYLEFFTSDDVAKLSDPKGRLEKPTEAKALFIAAHRACLKKYKQGYLVSRDAPLVDALFNVFPSLKKLKGEPVGGKENKSIYLAEIVKELEKLDAENSKKTGK